MSLARRGDVRRTRLGVAARALQVFDGRLQLSDAELQVGRLRQRRRRAQPRRLDKSVRARTAPRVCSNSDDAAQRVVSFRRDRAEASALASPASPASTDDN